MRIGVVFCDRNILTPDWAAVLTTRKSRAPMIVTFPAPKDPDRVFGKHRFWAKVATDSKRYVSAATMTAWTA